MLCDDIWVSHLFPLMLHEELMVLQNTTQSLRDLVWSEYPLLCKGMTGKAKLMPHQYAGVKWMMHRESECSPRGGILGFTMGLGKTVTALALCMATRKSWSRPNLIVCGKSALAEWLTQIRKFFDESIPVLILHPSTNRKKCQTVTYDELMSYTFVVTTYDMVKIIGKKGYCERALTRGVNNQIVRVSIASGFVNRDKVGLDLLFEVQWERIIADEAQNFANRSTLTSHCMFALQSPKRFCLSGTPVRNETKEFHTLLRFCGMSALSTSTPTDMILYKEYCPETVVLPELQERDHLIELSTNEQRVYDHYLAANKDRYRGMLLGYVQYSWIFALFTRLRQVCVACNIILGEDYQPSDNSLAGTVKLMSLPEEIRDLQRWMENDLGSAGVLSSKFSCIMSILRTIPCREKVVIFSSFKRGLDLLSKAISIECPGMEARQLDGATSFLKRQKILEEFRNNPSVRVLMMTYKCGSEALNLTVANHCIFVEPWWCGAVSAQARARVYRYTQKRPVFVHRIMVMDSIETRVQSVVQSKMSELDGMLTEVKKSSQLDRWTMGKILGM